MSGLGAVPRFRLTLAAPCRLAARQGPSSDNLRRTEPTAKVIARRLPASTPNRACRSGPQVRNFCSAARTARLSSLSPVIGCPAWPPIYSRPRSGSPHAPRSPARPFSVRPCGHGLLDCRAQRRQALGQVGGGERRPACDHATAEVDAHCRRDAGSLSRDHAADGRAHSPMNVGHRGHMWECGRHLRDVAELLLAWSSIGTIGSAASLATQVLIGRPPSRASTIAVMPHLSTKRSISRLTRILRPRTLWGEEFGDDATV